MLTGKYGLGIKHGLGIKRGLRTALKGGRLATSSRGTNVVVGEACELEAVLEVVPLSCVIFLTKY